MIEQVLREVDCPVHYASADGPGGQTQTWILEQWELARLGQRQQNSE